MFSLKFLKDIVERVVVTVAEAFLAAGVVLPSDFWDGENIQIALAAGIVSFLKALVASHVGNDPESASMVG